MTTAANQTGCVCLFVWRKLPRSAVAPPPWTVLFGKQVWTPLVTGTLMDANYDEQEKAFYHKVDILGRWRDVQASGSLLHQQFQEEIEGVTARRQHLMAVRPQLEKLDEQIATVARRLAAVQDDSDDGGWAAVAVGAACVGAVLLGVCLLFDPGWKTWASMVAGFAVAIGAAVISVRSREDASAQCAELRADLEDLRQQRAELLGDEN